MDRREGGFTLIEAPVALAIAALALGALTQGAAGGLQSTRVSGHYQEALSRARSRLAALAAAPVPGESSGDDGGGYAWQANVAPLATAGRQRDAAGPRQGSGAGSRAGNRATLLAVRVRVSWRMDGGEREVVLATERLGSAPPEAP